jgi:hypothetical protein
VANTKWVTLTNSSGSSFSAYSAHLAGMRNFPCDTDSPRGFPHECSLLYMLNQIGRPDQLLTLAAGRLSSDKEVH